MTGTQGHRDQPPLTAVERADRARRIAEAKAAGATWPEVAAHFGVSEKTARRAARAHADGTARLRADAADADAGTVLPAADPLGVGAGGGAPHGAGDVRVGGAVAALRGTKTDAADRAVELLPALRDELAVYAAGRRDRQPQGRVFTSGRGGRISEATSATAG